MRVTARATRSGDWWAIEVPEIPGLFTQAKRLDQVVDIVSDAAATLGHDVDDVSLEPVLSDGEAALLAELRASVARLREAQQEAATLNRQAASRLRKEGLPVRDVATLMGVSPQRVSALKAS